MNPRSSSGSMPPGRTGATPMATRQTSAVISSVPLAFSTVRVTEFPLSLVPTTLLSTRHLMPCFLNDLVSVAPISSSSTGSRFGIISMMVTLVPNALYMYANSTPMAPAPMMTISFGCSGRIIASFDEMTDFPLNGSGGSSRLLHPVVTRMFLPSMI